MFEVRQGLGNCDDCTLARPPRGVFAKALWTVTPAGAEAKEGEE